MSDVSSSSSSPPSEAMIELMAPDGYYKYLDIAKPTTSTTTTTTSSSSPSSANSNTSSASGSDDATAPLRGSQRQQQQQQQQRRSPMQQHHDAQQQLHETPPIDQDLVKKNYRKKALKLHPDKPGGDADTFRLLNRAQRVLLDPKLRQQYDILGIDLNDEIMEQDNDDHDQTVKENEEDEHSSSSQGIIQEIAGMALTSIIQLAVRTLMMGVISIWLVRYRWTFYPVLAFLAFVAYRIFQATGGGRSWDILSPLLISIGLFCMRQGRQQTTTVVGDNQGGDDWSMLFWFGESTVIATFTSNSVTLVPKTPVVIIAIAIFSTLAALWFRGKFWNYAIVVGFEVFLAIFVALAFPIVEFILEAILNEKLRKVGDKVRAHHEILEAYYAAKMVELAGGGGETSNKTSTTTTSASKKR